MGLGPLWRSSDLKVTFPMQGAGFDPWSGNKIPHTVKVKVAQPCPTLCDPMDYTVHEILQARILE